MAHTPPSVVPRTPVAARQLRMNLLRVAWLAIGLGLGLEILLAGAGLLSGDQDDATLGALAGNTAWPFLVCLGLAVGMAVSGGRPLLTGLAGLLVAPVAFVLARSLQKGLTDLLAAGSAPGTGGVALLGGAGVRAFEYGCLGLLVAWLGRQAWGGVWAHLGLGLAVGLLFGTLQTIFVPQPNLLSWAINELFYPAGCALILFISENLGAHLPAET